MKAALQREAFVNKRTITAETNMRLQRSFLVVPPTYTAPQPQSPVTTCTCALTTN